MAKKNTEDIEQNAAFTKEQILNSKKYRNRRDALGVVLKDDESYTIADIESLLDGFMKGKVK